MSLFFFPQPLTFYLVSSCDLQLSIKYTPQTENDARTLTSIFGEQQQMALQRWFRLSFLMEELKQTRCGLNGASVEPTLTLIEDAPFISNDGDFKKQLQYSDLKRRMLLVFLCFV